MHSVRKTILLSFCLLLLIARSNGVFAASVGFTIDGDITLNSSAVNSGNTGLITSMANGAFDNASFTTAFIDDGMGGMNNLEIKIFTLSAINIALTPLAFDLSGHDGISPPKIAFKASDDSFVYIEYADVSGPNFISISDVGASFNGLDAAFGYFEGKWVNNSYSPTIVPIPAAVWLFGSGLLGLVGVARRRKAIV